MTTLTWLPGARVHDLHPGIGNGPFPAGGCYGVALHVNVDEHGTPDSYWGNGNPGQVCPNFQVYKDGSVHQLLPLNWQPWCQIEGNYHYAAIETAGLPNEPLTDAQLAACARIMRAYSDELGVPLQLADAPGQRGLGTHQMGGQAWGGHACPGPIRAGQRGEILRRAATLGEPPHPSPSPSPTTPKDAAAMNLDPGELRAIAAAVWAHPITNPANKYVRTAASRLLDAELSARAAAATPKARS